MKNYNFFAYIITNFTKTVLYIGVTNNLEERSKSLRMATKGLIVAKIKVLLFRRRRNLILPVVKNRFLVPRNDRTLRMTPREFFHL
jgi:hypothetical protein